MLQTVMLTVKKKEKIIKGVQRAEKDTGSAEVQIALFSEEIIHLTTHLKRHKKDNHSRRGLLKMVSKRKRLLDYLGRTNTKRHQAIIKKLGLRK